MAPISPPTSTPSSPAVATSIAISSPEAGHSPRRSRSGLSSPPRSPSMPKPKLSDLDAIRSPSLSMSAALSSTEPTAVATDGSSATRRSTVAANGCASSSPSPGSVLPVTTTSTFS